MTGLGQLAPVPPKKNTHSQSRNHANSSCHLSLHDEFAGFIPCEAMPWKDPFAVFWALHSDETECQDGEHE